MFLNNDNLMHYITPYISQQSFTYLIGCRIAAVLCAPCEITNTRIVAWNGIDSALFGCVAEVARERTRGLDDDDDEGRAGQGRVGQGKVEGGYTYIYRYLKV